MERHDGNAASCAMAAHSALYISFLFATLCSDDDESVVFDAVQPWGKHDGGQAEQHFKRGDAVFGCAGSGDVQGGSGKEAWAAIRAVGRVGYDFGESMLGRESGELIRSV